MEDVSEETRYILEEFIIERAVEDGIDMGLVRPILDVDLTACKSSIVDSIDRSYALFQYHNIDKFNRLLNDYELLEMNSTLINEFKGKRDFKACFFDSHS